MPERVDHTATWNTRLEPFVERRTGRVRITLGLVAVFWVCGKCATDFVLPFGLLFTVTNRLRCLYLIGIAGLNENPIEGFGAGKG